MHSNIKNTLNRMTIKSLNKHFSLSPPAWQASHSITMQFQQQLGKMGLESKLISVELLGEYTGFVHLMLGFLNMGEQAPPDAQIRDCC